MIEPTSGTIWLDGQDTAAHGRRASCAGGIGYVIQHAGLFPHRTVVDNVATVPLLLGERQDAGPRRRRWSCSSGSACDPAFAERYPAQLSGGQQQRVGVARALAADPPVMLMDEPFSAVDPVVRDQLQDEFLRLQGELGKTIVFVTHDIDEAIKLGDQVAVLRVGGTLAQLAAPAELLAAPGRRLRRRTSSAATAATARSASRPRPALPTHGRSRTVAARRDAGEVRRPSATAGCWSSTRTTAPLGWVEPSPVDRDRASPRCCTAAAPSPRVRGSLRAALDAALSSPSRPRRRRRRRRAAARHRPRRTRCSPRSRQADAARGHDEPTRSRWSRRR